MALIPEIIYNHKLWQIMLILDSYLSGPVMVYHDGSGDRDLIIKSLSVSLSQSLTVAEAPERPYNILSHTPESTVLIGNDPDLIVSSLRLWSLWNGHSRVLLILEKEEYVHQWLKSLWNGTRAVNVAAMVIPPNEDGEFQFFTWFPYQENDCSNVTQITKIELSNLFPEKIRPPLGHCPLIAVTTIIPPIVIDDFYGLEPRIFHALAEKMGMTATYTRLPIGTYVWIILEDGKPVYGMKLIWDNKVDIMFSMLSSWIVLPYAEYTMPHARDESLWWVPAERPASRATAVYRAFTVQTWTVVGSVITAMFITLTLIFSYEKNSPSFAYLETVAITLNIASKAPLKKIHLFFVVVAYMYSLHITTGYQSSLIIFLSDVPRLKAIETVEELAHSDLFIEFHEGHRNIMTEMSELPIYALLNDPKRSKYGPINSLELVADPGKQALLGPNLPFVFKRDMEKGFYDEFGYPLVKPLRQPFYTSDMRFCMSRGHPLFSFFNRYIQMMVESGLTQYFVNEIARRPFRNSRHLQPFGVENVEGCFILLLAFLGLSFFVWVGEWVVFLGRKQFLSDQGFHRRAWINRFGLLSNLI